MFDEIQTAYRKLEELDHLKTEFISIAAHELRAPLAVILTYAELLEAEATGQVQQHLSQVTDGALQLKSVIDEMISLREIDTGEAEVHITDVVISTCIDNALDNLRMLALGKQQNLVVDAPADLPVARGDERLVFMILSNLLSNAIKFTPDGGTITVTARADDEKVTITVHDTGKGIPQDELERIFERFYQVENSLRRRHGGIGLGLALAREMAKLVHGRIEVQSTVGQGSSFALVLPHG
jgi:signal transduction histidine kinase